MNLLTTRNLSGLLLSSALLVAASLPAKSTGMGGANVGIVGGMTTFMQQNDTVKKSHDVYETIYGGNVGINGGFNWDLGSFIVGIDATALWNMASAETWKIDNAGAASNNKMKTELGFSGQVGLILGADLKTSMPFARVGYSYQSLTVSGKKPATEGKSFPIGGTAGTEDAKSTDGAHCFQWGLGVDTRMGPVVLGLEFTQDIPLGDVKSPGTVFGMPDKDVKESLMFNQVRVRVLYHL